MDCYRVYTVFESTHIVSTILEYFDYPYILTIGCAVIRISTCIWWRWMYLTWWPLLHLPLEQHCNTCSIPFFWLSDFPLFWCFSFSSLPIQFSVSSKQCFSISFGTHTLSHIIMHQQNSVNLRFCDTDDPTIIYSNPGKLCHTCPVTLTIQRPYTGIQENFVTHFPWHWRSNDHMWRFRKTLSHIFRDTDDSTTI